MYCLIKEFFGSFIIFTKELSSRSSRVAKIGILIVEFSNQLREHGASVRDAVQKASEARLRPILMTAIATVCGAIPIALATGAGAESRSSIGWVIIGGASFSTILSLFIVPVLYSLLARLTKPSSYVADHLRNLEREYSMGVGEEELSSTVGVTTRSAS